MLHSATTAPTNLLIDRRETPYSPQPPPPLRRRSTQALYRSVGPALVRRCLCIGVMCERALLEPAGVRAAC
jgi:hypothetical protein